MTCRLHRRGGVGEAAAGYGEKMAIKWAGALRDYSATAPDMFLCMRLIEESTRRRAGTFNFGRCSSGSGTHRFKVQWGFAGQSLPWAQWCPGGVTAAPSPDRAKFRLATAVCRVPLGVAYLAAATISHFLP